MNMYCVSLREFITVSSSGQKRISISDIISSDNLSNDILNDIEFYDFLQRNNIIISEKLSQSVEAFLIRTAQIDFNNCSEEERINREAAISTLYTNYEKLLMKLSSNALMIADNSTRAVLCYEDILSEASIAFLKAIKSYDINKGANLCTYIYRVVNNTLLTVIHSRKYDSNPNSKSKRIKISDYLQFCDSYYARNGMEPTEDILMKKFAISKSELDKIKYNLYKGTNTSLDYVSEYHEENTLAKTNDNFLERLYFNELMNAIKDILHNYDTSMMTKIKRAAFERNIEIFYFCFTNRSNKGIFNICAEKYGCTAECIRSIYKKMLGIVQHELVNRGYGV